MERDDGIKKAKVINFPNQSAFYDFLDELKDAFKEKRLNNFICIYDYEYKEAEKQEGFMAGIDKYWFGEKSCIYLLGLVDIMKSEIRAYIANKCEEKRKMGVD